MNVGSIHIERIADIETYAVPVARAFANVTKAQLQEQASVLGPLFIDPNTLDLFLSFHISWPKPA